MNADSPISHQSRPFGKKYCQFRGFLQRISKNNRPLPYRGFVSFGDYEPICKKMEKQSETIPVDKFR